MAYKHINGQNILIACLVILSIVYIGYNMTTAYENYVSYNPFSHKIFDDDICAASSEIPDCVKKGCTWTNNQCASIDNIPMFFQLFA